MDPPASIARSRNANSHTLMIRLMRERFANWNVWNGTPDRASQHGPPPVSRGDFLKLTQYRDSLHNTCYRKLTHSAVTQNSNHQAAWLSAALTRAQRIVMASSSLKRIWIEKQFTSSEFVKSNKFFCGFPFATCGSRRFAVPSPWCSRPVVRVARPVVRLWRPLGRAYPYCL